MMLSYLLFIAWARFEYQLALYFFFIAFIFTLMTYVTLIGMYSLFYEGFNTTIEFQELTQLSFCFLLQKLHISPTLPFSVITHTNSSNTMPFLTFLSLIQSRWNLPQPSTAIVNHFFALEMQPFKVQQAIKGVPQGGLWLSKARLLHWVSDWYI